MTKVLAILTDGFEEIEAVAPIDLLRRAGVEVRIAAVATQSAAEPASGADTARNAANAIPRNDAALGPLAITGRCGMVLRAECTLAEALAEAAATGPYDCVLVPGGPGVKTLRASAAVLAAVREQHAAGRLVAAICAAPLVLLDAGILGGRRYTSHGSVVDELPETLANEAVVVDAGSTSHGTGTADGLSAGGPIVTSRGAGTAVEFGLKLVELLRGKTESMRIATDIHFLE